MVNSDGVSTSKTTETTGGAAADYDFTKLLMLSQSWTYLNSLQRSAQVLFPYALLLGLEAGIGVVLFMFIVFAE